VTCRRNGARGRISLPTDLAPCPAWLCLHRHGRLPVRIRTLLLTRFPVEWVGDVRPSPVAFAVRQIDPFELPSAEDSLARSAHIDQAGPYFTIRGPHRDMELEIWCERRRRLPKGERGGNHRPYSPMTSLSGIPHLGPDLTFRCPPRPARNGLVRGTAAEIAFRRAMPNVAAALSP
jgi:hypothetical protein